MKGSEMLDSILIVMLTMMLLGVVPRWPQGRIRRYCPNGGLGVIVLAVVTHLSSLCPAASISLSLVNPGADIISSGAQMSVEVRATYDVPLVAVQFMLTASGDAEAIVVGRSADPVAPAGLLTYISATSQEPFNDDLSYDLKAASQMEVLLDLEYGDQSGGPMDGMPVGQNLLIETLSIRLTGAGPITLSLAAPSAALTQGTPDGQYFNDAHIELGAGTVVVNVRPAPADVDGDGDVDQSDFGYLQRCYTGSDPGSPVGGICVGFDYDADGDVDNEDWLVFEECTSGPGIPADPNCVN
jgi:hypothetical protein